MANDVFGRQYVRGKDETFIVTPVLDTGAYTTADVLFPVTKIADAAVVERDTVVLFSVGIVDKDSQGFAMDLHFFSGSPSTFGVANGTVAATDADNVAYWLGKVSVGTADWTALGGSKVASIPQIGLPLSSPAGSKDLYMAGVTGGTPTHTASGLTFKLGVIR